MGDILLFLLPRKSTPALYDTVGRKGKREVSSPSKAAVRLTQHQVKSNNFGSASKFLGTFREGLVGGYFRSIGICHPKGYGF